MAMTRRPAWVIAMLVLLAGCARSQLVSDLHSAEAPCRDQQFKDKSSLVDCLGGRERPVWVKDDPATLDLYDGFARERADLARQYDSGALTPQQYSDKLDQLEAETGKALTERRKQSAAAQ